MTFPSLLFLLSICFLLCLTWLWHLDWAHQGLPHLAAMTAHPLAPFCLNHAPRLIARSVVSSRLPCPVGCRTSVCSCATLA